MGKKSPVTSHTSQSAKITSPSGIENHNIKISVIGAGNVGGTTALRLAQEGLGDVVLLDIQPGLAQGKAYDLEDACQVLKHGYHVTGTNELGALKDSDIIVVTAGLARKPGMTREDLVQKNYHILKDVCSSIKECAPQAIVIVVTNPLDVMTYCAVKLTGFNQSKVFGMGVTLDASRFANLISQELKISPVDVDACVVGPHGEGMLPLPRFTTIHGVSLNKFLDPERIKELTIKTVDRGKEIVALLGSGSAYFAPSAAITSLVKAIVRDEKTVVGVSALLTGQYGVRDVCLGVPCRLGRKGIEQIIELELEKEEKDAFITAGDNLKNLIGTLPFAGSIV